MEYVEDIISSDVHYLISVINYLFYKFNVPQVVSVNSDMEFIEHSNNFKIRLEYILHREDEEKPEIIFSTIAEVSTTYYYETNTPFIRDLNKRFFAEILLHTNFNTNLDIRDTLKQINLN
jgi:hypothetical protein